MILTVLTALFLSTPAPAFHGPVVNTRHFPSSVYLRYRRNDTRMGQLCTAAIIAPNALLTAAHCLGDFKQSIPLVGPQSWQCEMADRQILVTDSTGATQRNFIRAAYIHPSVRDNRYPGLYNKYKGLSDLAVIELQHALPGPAAALAATPAVGQAVWLGGYGLFSNNSWGLPRDRRLDLRAALLPLAERSRRQMMVLPVSRTNFVDHGDSGGPVYNEAMQIIAINSRQESHETQTVSVPGTDRLRREIVSFRSYASRTDVAARWIREAAAGRIEAQACSFVRDTR